VEVRLLCVLVTRITDRSKEGLLMTSLSGAGAAPLRVLVVGGSLAGLSSAIALARSSAGRVGTDDGPNLMRAPTGLVRE
jgi:hypothetical protein